MVAILTKFQRVDSLGPGDPYIEGILLKGPYLSCVSMAGRALLAGYPRIMCQNTWKTLDKSVTFHLFYTKATVWIDADSQAVRIF